MDQSRHCWPLAAVILLVAAGPAHAAELALKRVMLSSGGVGYFEYAARVEGNATLTLDVPLDQIDDILKSLVLYDDSGTAGEATLPGRQPLVQVFADLPFDRAALHSEPALLNALQGAEIDVPGPKPMKGRLVRVVAETARGKDGLAITRHRVSVLTKAGLEQFILEHADAVTFADPDLQKTVAAALSRIAAHHADKRRRLSIETRGTGARTVRVGYVVGTPLWKASYRLSLPTDAAADTARLQGWAVLENFSGRPWHDVALTLISGNPVSFRQALYESYYVKRPSVPVETTGHVLPPPDLGGISGALAQKNAARQFAPRAADKARMRAEAAQGAMPGAAAPAPPPMPAPARIAAAAAREAATQTVFTLPYKITVGAGQSLMVPILDRALPAQRVDLYEASVAPRHPLAAIALTNAGDSGLPPGVLTLYEQATGGGAVYLGDARLAAFPPGEKRILSYAVDGKVTVDRSSDERRAIVKAAIAEGVLRVTRLAKATTTYRIQPAAGAPERHLIIEHPRRAGWRLASPDPKTVELTEKTYRIPLTLHPDKGAVLAVTLERPVQETVGLADIGDDRLAAFVSSSELDPAVRKALGELAERRRTVSRLAAQRHRQQQQRQQLVGDESRLRQNLRTVGRETALYKRTLDKLGATETAIDNLSTALTKTDDALAAAKGELQRYIANLSL